MTLSPRQRRAAGGLAMWIAGTALMAAGPPSGVVQTASPAILKAGVSVHAFGVIVITVLIVAAIGTMRAD